MKTLFTICLFIICQVTYCQKCKVSRHVDKFTKKETLLAKKERINGIWSGKSASNLTFLSFARVDGEYGVYVIDRTNKPVSLSGNEKVTILFDNDETLSFRVIPMETISDYSTSDLAMYDWRIRYFLYIPDSDMETICNVPIQSVRLEYTSRIKDVDSSKKQAKKIMNAAKCIFYYEE